MKKEYGGWSCDDYGLWRHPNLGEILRQTGKSRRWFYFPSGLAFRDIRVGPFRTMKAAVEHAEGVHRCAKTTTD